MARVQFPKAIVKEILFRLPVKSLLRFKSLSKEWNSLISSSGFVKNHIKISTKNTAYINDKLIRRCSTIPSDLLTRSLQSVIEAVSDRVWFECPSVQPGSRFLFLDSCNGLVCVLVKPNTFIVWNPATREKKLFGSPDFVSGSNLKALGFGYDKLHDDYKVVQLFSDNHVVVYSLGTNYWKRLLNRTSGLISNGLGKFIHGAIHWSEYSYLKRWFILSFDLATETFAELPAPDLGTNSYCYDIETYGGWLAVFALDRDYINVWVMQEYGRREPWTKVLHIPFSVDLSSVPHFIPRVVCQRILMNYGSRLRICDLSNLQPHQLEPATTEIGATSPDLDYFPPEIIREILLRLPVKSLLRFKSVSKELRSLISSSDFVKAQLKISTDQRETLIFGSRPVPAVLYSCSLHSLSEASSIDNEWLDRVRFLGYGLFDPGRDFSFVDSCNGLVCVRLPYDISIFLNPATRKSTILCDPNFDHGSYVARFGFGYDESHDDYKVVEVLGFADRSQQVRVFSFNTKSWRVVQNMPVQAINVREEYGKFIHGAIHWIGSHADRLHRWVYAFDLDTETFVELPAPNFEIGAYLDEIKTFGGWLAVFYRADHYMNVLVMKEYGTGGSWTRLYHIPLCVHSASGAYYLPRLVCRLRDGRMVMNCGSRLVISDLSEKSYPYNPTMKLNGITYMESLVSPRGSLDEI